MASGKDLWWRASRRLADFFDPTPRRVSAFWALYAWSSVAAYWQHTPSQLERVAALTPTPWGIEIMWTIPAILLTIGAIPAAPRRTYRIARTVGASVLAGLLMLWSLEFYIFPGDRSWVTSRSYFAFALILLVCSPILGRAYPVEREGKDV